MFTENIERDRKYCGYNPDFAKRAREKQKRNREEMMRDKIDLLQGVVDKQKDHITLLKSQIKMLMDRKDISPIEEQDLREKSKVSVRDIIQHVAKKHKLRPADITGPSRNRHIIDARFEAIVMTTQLRPEMSLPQIGKQFGGRDHTTILSALRKMGLR